MLLRRVFSKANQLGQSSDLLSKCKNKANFSIFNSQNEEDHFTADGQLIDTYKTLETYLPPNAFESVRQVLYGNKCEEPELSQKTLSKAEELKVEIKNFRMNAERE